ncbi:MAG: ATP-binding protein [Candidatus Melainabacteria bacterium]|jgi:uncharacterized protein|nr:ATP-binding protein [Candidatus Melainabacteria bacterium]
MINRKTITYIENSLFASKAIVLLGARQVGKTTILEIFKESYRESELMSFNCDYLDDRDLLAHDKVRKLIKILGSKKLILIDEAQKVFNIGEVLKILVDEFKDSKQIIATGSSSINILDHVSESLTGRKIVIDISPLSLEELKDSKGLDFVEKNLDDLMIYGTYPEIVLEEDPERKKQKLEEISSSYLYKDILEIEDIKKSQVLDKLVKLLALQISSELSFTNLSKTLGIDQKTVEKYVNILEKAFVIKLLAPYSTGGKREITKKHKIYFMDLGIRNALINNFNPIDLRVDKGQIWENFIFIERLKFLRNNQDKSPLYFWRTYDGAEVDLVELRNGKLEGFEFKYQGKPRSKPKQWLENANASYKVVTRENYDEFLL